MTLYLHLPFCDSKCDYCSFSSYPGMTPIHASYVEALCLELAMLSRESIGFPLTSVFIGGGTPTLLAEPLMSRLLDYLENHCQLSGCPEVTIEANPATLTESYLDLLLAKGVNRLSIGIQSLRQQELETLGRVGSVAESVAACGRARRSGFTNINVDLLYGIPGQRASDWQISLGWAIDLGVDHLSLYQLTPAEQTPLAAKLANTSLSMPTEEEIEEMDVITARLTEKNGYQRYEIANYAQPGCRCRHNVNYWENRDYLAAGAGAVSSLGTVREKRVEDPAAYIERLQSGESVVDDREWLDREAKFRETVIMGLRMEEGVNLIDLQQRFSLDLFTHYGELLNAVLANGLVEISGNHLRLTERGHRYSNQVMAQLV